MAMAYYHVKNSTICNDSYFFLIVKQEMKSLLKSSINKKKKKKKIPSLKKIKISLKNTNICQLFCKTDYEGKCGNGLRAYTQGDRPFCFLAAAFIISYRTPIIKLVKKRALQDSNHSTQILNFLRSLQCNNFYMPGNLGCSVKCKEPKDLPSIFVENYYALRPDLKDQKFNYGFPLQALKALLMSCKIDFDQKFDYSPYYDSDPVLIVRTKYDTTERSSYEKFYKYLKAFTIDKQYSAHVYVGTIIEFKETPRNTHAVSIIRCSENNEHVICDSNEKLCKNIEYLNSDDKNYYFDNIVKSDNVFIQRSAL